MALIPLKTSRAWDPEEYARFPDDVRHRHLRSDLAEALLGIGRITTTTLPPEPGVFPPRRRIMETLEIWVDPMAAHARAAAENSRVAFLTNDDFARRLAKDREKEISAREEKLAKDLAELENLRRELREERQQVVTEFFGDCEFMGRR